MQLGDSGENAFRKASERVEVEEYFLSGGVIVLPVFGLSVSPLRHVSTTLYA